MSNSLIKHLALVSESDRVDLDELTVVAAALQKQTVRDLGPIWNIQATVQAFGRLEDVPLDYWPMIVRDDIGFNAAGIHLDEDGQPFALITSSSDNDVWSLTAAHECLEMLVDPYGDRLVAGDSPNPDQGRVLFLVEVCDPSEASEFGYTINGVLVSDFYTPHFFDPVTSIGVRYSYTDALTEPRQVLRGGYLSWLEPTSGHWWQETWFSGDRSKFRDLGPLSAADGSIRNQIDRVTGRETHRAIAVGRAAATAAGLNVAASENPAAARAAALHSQIARIVEQTDEPAETASIARRSAPSRKRRGRKQ